MIVTMDTETTGLDFYHGARPYFVTSADNKNRDRIWFIEWDVNSRTREPGIADENSNKFLPIPLEDLQAIRDRIAQADQLVFQNAKFDALGLSFIGIDLPWNKVHDTLIAGHVLESGQTHNLTDMALRWLRVNIEPKEQAVRQACEEARRLCRRKDFSAVYGEWAIAERGRPDMPSAKDTVWKYDMWLPLAIAKECEYPPDHPWYTVLQDYANLDAETTLALWEVQRAELNRRGLWEIYLERLKVLEVAYHMERRGISLSKGRLDELMTEFREESGRAAETCVGLAASYGYDLDMPKSGSNKSLDYFLFGNDAIQGEIESVAGAKLSVADTLTDSLCLQPVKYTEKRKPSVDKEALDIYVKTLEVGTKEHLFCKKLQQKRKRDTAIAYMEGYSRFWKCVDSNEIDDYRCKCGKVTYPHDRCMDCQWERLSQWYTLHPSLNPTGTNTLRWSCSNPNEQNISKQSETCPRCKGKKVVRVSLGGGIWVDDHKCEMCRGTGEVSLNLRYCFGPAPGREWWSLDAKNIELRIPFYESGEPEMVALFENEKAPPFYGSNHALICSVLWADEWNALLEKVGPEKVADAFKKKYKHSLYQWTKNGNFAVQYGAVNKEDGTGTADRAYHKPGAQTIVESRFTKLAELNRYWINFARKHGYVETLPDKTVNPQHGYPLEVTRSEWGAILPTVPLNYHVQSTAMWWTARAMTESFGILSQWNSKIPMTQHQLEAYFLVMQVHDELVFDFPKRAHPKKDPKRSNLGRIREIQNRISKIGDDFIPRIPQPVGVEYHEHTWADGENV